MRRRFNRVAGAVALSCAALLAIPATAAADPVDPVALAAAEAIENSRTAVAEPTDSDPFAALTAANDILTGLGITPFFYPTAAINCSATGAPLGITPAIAGGAAGPWPSIKLPLVPPLDAVESGETMFAFVPAGIVDDSEDQSGMQVAWFNVNTFQGGFVDMGGATATFIDSVLSNVDLPPFAANIARSALQNAVKSLPAAGARLAPVETGTGTVLAAVFGNVTHNTPEGEKTCFFFPTVGLVDVG